MINITLENFQDELITASSQTPVLLDIWAPWCEPCKQLGPILEQLEQDYSGRFILAKLDADAVPQIAQQLSQMFGVRSIPLSVMFKDGQPVDGFVGVKSAAEIKEFLDKYVAAVEELQAQAEADLAQQALEQGDVDLAKQRLAQALADDAANVQIRFDYAKLLLQEKDFTLATELLQQTPSDVSANTKLLALQYWLDAQQVAAAGVDMLQLEQAIAENKRDFSARLQKAQLLMTLQLWCEAMDELLEILMRDKDWQEGIARKTYIAILDIMEPPAPKVEEGKIPPQDPTIVRYRRLLSSVVLS